MRVHGVTQLCPAVCDPLDCSPPGSSCPWASPRKNTGVSCHFLLQGPTPGDLPSPGIEPILPASPALTGGLFTTEPPSSLTRDQTLTPALGTWNLSHWTTRESPDGATLKMPSLSQHPAQTTGTPRLFLDPSVRFLSPVPSPATCHQSLAKLPYCLQAPTEAC